jgi:cell division septal protein FtsQ
MKKSTPTRNPVKSWRDIQSNTRRFKDTDAARQRRWGIALKTGMGIMACLTLTVVVLATYYLVQTRSESIFSAADNQQRVESIDWRSDGVLNREWFYRNYPDAFSQSISRIDIHDFKRRLESSGQIREAHLTIVFPNKLRVQISEREPIMRARVANPQGGSKIVLISREGFVYEGQGYPRETLRRLPGVSGLRLRHDGTAYLPVEGMEPVARLLDRARETMPDIYMDWSVVSLENYFSESDRPSRLIEIHSRSGRSMVFAPAQYDEQLVRLRNILAMTVHRQMGNPRRIDLSFRDEAVVQY